MLNYYFALDDQTIARISDVKPVRNKRLLVGRYKDFFVTIYSETVLDAKKDLAEMAPKVIKEINSKKEQLLQMMEDGPDNSKNGRDDKPNLPYFNLPENQFLNL